MLNFGNPIGKFCAIFSEPHVDAQGLLGYLYQKGLGVEIDYDKAKHWLELAASQGDTYSQVNLGILYADGLGVEQDYEKAKYWYEKAAEQGDDVAKENLEILKKLMNYSYESNDGKYNIPNFYVYWNDFLVDDVKFIMRFAIPSYLQLTEQEHQSFIILTPNGEYYDEAEMFFSINISRSNAPANKDIHNLLSSFTEHFQEDVCFVDQELSMLSTYDKRMFSAYSLVDNTLEYTRKTIFIPFAEELSILINISLQVNSLNENKKEKYCLVFNDIIRSFKIQEENIDQKEKLNYINELYFNDQILQSIGK